MASRRYGIMTSQSATAFFAAVLVTAAVEAAANDTSGSPPGQSRGRDEQIDRHPTDPRARAAAEAPADDPRETPRPLVFGLNASTSDAQLQQAVAAGCTNVRIGAGWDLVEPEPGQYRWSHSDRDVSQCERYGLEPIFLIVATPRWALDPEKRDKPWGWPAPPEFYPQARTFYRTLADRYKGRVRYYEFWNEQNGFGWHEVNKPDEYAPILKLAYAALKEADPDCVVAIGGLDGAGWKGYPSYLERLYELGCGDYFDAVGVHPYRIDGPIDGRSLQRIHEILVRHGHGDRKLWLTEYGWSNEYGHDNKARWLAESLDMLTSPEFHFVFQASVHTLRDFDRHEYGLCDRQGNPRPGYHVFKNYPKDWSVIIERRKTQKSEPKLLLTDGFETKRHEWIPFGQGFEIVRAEKVGIMPEQGEHVLMSGSKTSLKSGGAYLRVAVPADTPLRLSARVLTSHRGSSLGRCRVGIDPRGGTDPDAPSVVWSRAIETYDAWDTAGVGQGAPIYPGSDHVTLFLRYDRANDGLAPRVFDEIEFMSIEDTLQPPGIDPDTTGTHPAG